MNIRELRLWHWKQVVQKRSTATQLAQDQANPVQILQYNRAADFHLHAVQCLNDYCPAGTTAEQDYAHGI